MATFVINDESVVNSYGFKVKNSELSLERFKNNPVMLEDHWHSLGSIIGRWENLRIEGSKLLGDSVFDLTDEEVKKIADKVEKGFIKGCSMGFMRYSKPLNIGEDGFLPEGVVPEFGGELLEVSLVAVPSNKNSIKLFAEQGVEEKEESFKLSLNNFYKDKEDKNKMEVERLRADLKERNEEVIRLNAEKAQLVKEAAKALLSGLGLTTEQEENYLSIAEKMGIKAMQGVLPKKALVNEPTHLNANVSNPVVANESGFPKTYEQLMALPEEEFERIQKENPKKITELINSVL